MTYVRYIDKTRDYYLSQGYDKPYRWAHFDDVPFTPLTKPLARSRVVLVSTSEIAIRDESGFEDPTAMGQVGSVYSIPAATPIERLYSRTHSYDMHATHLDDVDAFYPTTPLHEILASGRIGGLTARFHGAFNAYSQRRTSEVDAPEVLKRCREDGADVAVLVPV